MNAMLLGKVALAIAIALFAAFVGPLLVEDAWLRFVLATVGMAVLVVGLRRLRRYGSG